MDSELEQEIAEYVEILRELGHTDEQIARLVKAAREEMMGQVKI